jgi:two-component system, OmpR family, response regulator MprA
MKPEDAELASNQAGDEAIPHRILVVEDERAMSQLLEQALEESGYAVSVAENGREGLKKAPEHDLLIVDVMMPVLNGFDMVRELRELGNKTPVLFLTAKDAVSDRVKGLDLGGDDYLMKPFKLEELLARVRALLRRSSIGQDTLEFADLWMDRRARKVRRGDRWLYLSNTEFSLLEQLLLHRGEPVSKQTLLREVWNDDSARDENVVEVYINYLRSKMEVLGMPRLVQTVRGKGYILEASEEQS